MNENNLTPVKKTRTPRTFDTITKGALSLPLKERAALRDELTRAIEMEVQALQEQAKEASGFLAG